MSNPWPPHYDDPAVRWDAGWTWLGEDALSALQNLQNKPPRMKRQDYYPSRIADQIPWLENFRTKLPTYTATLGLLPATVDAAVASARYTIYVLSQWLSAVRAFGPASTEAVDALLGGTGAGAMVLPAFTVPAPPAGVAAVPPGSLTRLFDLIREIKEANAYTEAIGLDLGIVGSPDTASHPAPGLRAEAVQGTGCQCVRLPFQKWGHQGVTLESRRGGGNFEQLAIDTESPYLDERPLLIPTAPEIREYRARFWDKGTPNGDWTDVVKVTVSP